MSINKYGNEKEKNLVHVDAYDIFLIRWLKRELIRYKNIVLATAMLLTGSIYGD